MKPCRVHITGASGCGTTTLGRMLAGEWSVPHADADDYFWMPTSPPYTHKRAVADRLRLMEEVFVGRDAWVLSGSVMGWGDPLLAYVDAVVFLSVDQEVRLGRLHAREVTRYGARIDAGGDREGAHREFMAWAEGYEDPAFDGRSRARHEEWLRALSCPVLRLDSAIGADELLTAVVESGPAPAPPRRSAALRRS